MANRQAVLVEPCKPLVVQDNPIPTAPSGGLVVKTHYGGICHTDMHLWENALLLGDGKYMKVTDAPGYKLPVVLGHEIAGEVHSIGPNQPADAPKVQVGDNVLVFTWPGCRTCGVCKAGESQDCELMIATTPGMGKNGGFGSYVTVLDSTTIVKAPAGLPLDVGALLGCSGLTSYNAIYHTKPYIEFAVKAKGRATLLMVGAGGLGLWGIQIAKAILPNTKVVVADIGEDKLKTAKEAGADVTVLWDPKASDEDIINKTKEACDGGFDASIDFVNTGPTATRIFHSAAKRATNVVVGLFGGILSLPLVELPMKALSYQGVFTGPLVRFQELVELTGRKKLKPPPITHIKVEDAYDILLQLKAGTYKGRAIIKYV